MKRFGMALVALTLIAVLAGCSTGADAGPVETIEVTAGNMAFNTQEIKLEKGKTYKLVLNNRDALEHDLSVETMPLKNVKAGHSDHGAGNKAALHVHADAGKTESVQFTPTEAGTYTFFCTVSGHKEAGMTGKIIVN